jgi:hypothetical protein
MIGDTFPSEVGYPNEAYNQKTVRASPGQSTTTVGDQTEIHPAGAAHFQLAASVSAPLPEYRACRG